MVNAFTLALLKYFLKSAMKKGTKDGYKYLYKAGLNQDMLDKVKSGEEKGFSSIDTLTRLLNNEKYAKKAIRQEAKERSVGSLPTAMSNIVFPTVGNTIQTLGDTVKAATGMMPAMLAAAGAATQQTNAEQFMGMPNIGAAAPGIMTAVSTPLQTLIQGATDSGANLANSIGDTIGAVSRERKMNENALRTLTDMPSGDITPSQARVTEQQLKMARAAGTTTKAASN